MTFLKTGCPDDFIGPLETLFNKCLHHIDAGFTAKEVDIRMQCARLSTRDWRVDQIMLNNGTMYETFLEYITTEMGEKFQAEDARIYSGGILLRYSSCFLFGFQLM